MKFLCSLCVSFILTLLLSFNLVFAQSIEVDLNAGQEVFTANCTACHLNGGNSVSNEKTLQIDALIANVKDSVNAIITQVTNGNGAMPPFGDRLSEDEIQNVANYVLNQAVNKSW